MDFSLPLSLYMNMYDKDTITSGPSESKVQI